MNVQPCILPELNLPIQPVDREELARLMEMPGSSSFGIETESAVEQTEAWCHEHLRIIPTTRLTAIQGIHAERIDLSDGTVFRTGRKFAEKMRRIEAQYLIATAFTLGSKVDARIAELWQTDYFSESYILRSYAAALMEDYRHQLTVHFSEWALRFQLFISPCSGPGYEDWPLQNSRELYRFINPGESIHLHESGFLEPMNSMLLVFGLTAQPQPDRRNVPCHRCSFASCRFRRRSSQAGVAA